MNSNAGFVGFDGTENKRTILALHQVKETAKIDGDLNVLLRKPHGRVRSMMAKLNRLIGVKAYVSDDADREKWEKAGVEIEGGFNRFFEDSDFIMIGIPREEELPYVDVWQAHDSFVSLLSKADRPEIFKGLEEVKFSILASKVPTTVPHTNFLNMIFKENMEVAELVEQFAFARTRNFVAMPYQDEGKKHEWTSEILEAFLSGVEEPISPEVLELIVSDAIIGFKLGNDPITAPHPPLKASPDGSNGDLKSKPHLRREKIRKIYDIANKHALPLHILFQIALEKCPSKEEIEDIFMDVLEKIS